VTVILNGSDDEGYTYCAVAVTPPTANICDNAAFNFIVGEDACTSWLPRAVHALVAVGPQTARKDGHKIVGSAPLSGDSLHYPSKRLDV